jgi:hypothetical protein
MLSSSRKALKRNTSLNCNMSNTSYYTNPVTITPTTNTSRNYRADRYQHLCPYAGCGRLFASPHNVDQHIREQHTGERPYKCKRCGKAFARPGTLNRHLAKVHKVKDAMHQGRKRKRTVVDEQDDDAQEAEQHDDTADSPPVPGLDPTLTPDKVFSSSERTPEPDGDAFQSSIDRTSTKRRKQAIIDDISDPLLFDGSTIPPFDADLVGMEHFPIDPDLTADTAFTSTSPATSPGRTIAPKDMPSAQPERCVFCARSFTTLPLLAAHFHAAHGFPPNPLCTCDGCKQQFKTYSQKS